MASVRLSSNITFARRPRLLCLFCQSRKFGTSYRRLAEEPAAAKKPTTKPDPTATATATAKANPTEKPSKPVITLAPELADAPRPYGKRAEKFTPKPLSRPIGMMKPPQPGENTGIDRRTLRQRRDDFVDYEKHLKKRERLTNLMSRPYFRDWGNLRFHKGKTFVAPPRLFKGALSLFFPNFYGKTMLKTDRKPRDTTPALRGRISIVSVFSGMWAENQTKTFVGKEKNPELDALLAQNADRTQLVQINLEDNSMKRLLIRLFAGSIRRKLGEANWGRYFVVRNRVSDEISERIGLLNSRVGYVYLLDGECRIRWAGSGPSEDHEREGLVKGVRRLIDEDKGLKK
ncbi:ATP10 protein-domain-containing protein [Whalleya microplaca]|nr:ATP10 protein-domain-containing protein [Whalleya microplaca]